MSASYVRETVRTWCGEVATAESLPFYDTINQAETPRDPIWWTVEFDALFSEGTFCEPKYIETGFIKVIAVARPGKGDIAAVKAIETVVIELMKKADPSGRVVLETYDAVNDDSEGTAQKDYRVAVNIDYRHSL